MLKTIKLILITSLLVLSVLSCEPSKSLDVYYNGNIYTINYNNDKVDALVVEDGVILYTGAFDTICKIYGDKIGRAHV